MKKAIFSRLALIAAALLVGVSAFAQKVTVTGVVTDAQGQPIIGAAVFEKGTTTGASTDIDGKYTIAVKSGATLVYSCIGYADATRTATQGTINVTLADDSQMLEETVVIGYGVQKKSDVTGAIASVSKDALENRSVDNVAAALAGKSSGVQVLSSSGRPGDVASIRVRGVSSNSSSATGPLVIVDGLQSSISQVDPQNVESIEVLKDAASAAIYGAQAGNGVVIITTKSGKKGDGKIFYDGSYTIERLGYHPTMMNAKQYQEWMIGANFLSQTTVDQYWDGKTDTDWFNAVFPGGHAQRHTVGAQGANDKGSYYLSLSYLDHDGVLYGDRDSYNRLNVQLNADYQIKKWFKVGTNNTFATSSKSYLNNVNGGDDTIMSMIYANDPMTPLAYKENELPADMKTALADGKPLLKTPDGDYIASSEFVSRSFNPLIYLYRSPKNWQKATSFQGTTFANLTPVKGLVITSRLGYHFSASNNFLYTAPWYVNGQVQNTQHSLSDQTNYSLSYQWENFANYSHTFAKKHNFDAMVGMSFIEGKSYYTQGNTNMLKGYADNMLYLSNSDPNATDDVYGAPGRSAQLAYFARLGYNYDNRYFVQANFRADAFDSSKLDPSNRWGYFPSFSLGWNVTNEPFMQNVSKDALSFLKVRASWGINGNIAALSGYQYAATVAVGSTQSQSTGNTILGSAPNKLANPSLRWEQSKQLDLGVDARFLRDRLTVGIDYYNKDTDGLLVQVTPSYTTGQSSLWMNSGAVNNRGVEFDLSWKDSIGDFSYSVSGNISHNRNLVTYLDPTITRIGGVKTNNSHYTTYFEQGFPVWYMYGYRFTGINPEDGTPQFDDMLDGKPGLTVEDQEMVGNAQPDFTYGITVNLAWKGIDFTVFGSGSQGNDIWFAPLRSDNRDRNLPSVFYTEAWRNPGDQARYPKFGEAVTGNYCISSAVVYDGSYFRINQIQLGYTLPKKLLEKIYISNLRVYVSLDDFFTFSKYMGFDPVTAGDNTSTGLGIDRGAYPSAKRAMFGVNLSF